MADECRSIADEIILPANCAVVFGIPTSEGSFRDAQIQSNRDFARRFLGGWDQYYAQWVADFVDFRETVLRWGVNVFEDVTLLRFGDIFRTDNVRVLVLFSHWINDNVEFSDGLASVSDILRQVPPTFSGIIDLCVCHPDLLATQLVINRPNCLVRYIPRKAKPTYWLYYYVALFALLRQGSSTYISAMTKLTGGFLDWAKRVGEKKS